MNDNDKYLRAAKETVLNYYNGHVESTKDQITLDSVYVVWSCKTLQNFKALLSTDIPDGMYYEFTYNGDKNEAYFDAYVKKENVCIKMDLGNY